MNKTEIEERVKKVISRGMGVDILLINNDDLLADVLYLDSLDMLDLIMSLEDEFEVEIPDDEPGYNFYDGFSLGLKVQSIINLVEKKLIEKDASMMII